MALDIAKIKGIKAGPKKPLPPKPPLKIAGSSGSKTKINPSKIKGLGK